MVAVQRCASSVALVQQVRKRLPCFLTYTSELNHLVEEALRENFHLQFFANSISRLLLPVDGAHSASCEEMAAAMSKAEAAAHKGLQQCIDTVMAEV